MQTIKIEKTTTEEVQVTFPLYYKLGDTLIKIVSPDSYLTLKTKVSGSAKSATVSQNTGYSLMVSHYYQNGEQITKHDFENALDLALSSLVALPTLNY